MPVEFEIKTILDVNHKKLQAQLKDYKVKDIIDINQGYLTKEARLRHCISLAKEFELYIFSFKKRIENYHLEIEKEISRDDFVLGWTQTDKKLSKIRYKVKDDGNLWDIDFFYQGHHDNVYFVMAEIELPLEHPIPSRIPAFIKEHTLFEVPPEDGRFKNSNLTNKDEVTKMLESLRAKYKK